MTAISQQLADITVLSIVVRILLSTFCAGTLGFERERHNQAAGFRTYIIVSDASALVMMTNIFVAGLGETDLVRMSASVITGLGFLGAGTILVTRNQEVRGLTTAAGLWAVAIIGTAFGAGFYAGGIICAAYWIADARGRPHATPPSAIDSKKIAAKAGPQPATAEPAACSSSASRKSLPAGAM